MAQSVDVQKLLVRGLLGGWFAFGGLMGQQVAMAAGPLGPLTVKRISLQAMAQADQKQADETNGDTLADAEDIVEDDVPFSELNEALTAARSRLTELTKAAEIAKVAGELREKLQAIEAENRQLKSVLDHLQTDNNQLVQFKQNASSRITELESQVNDGTAEAQRLDEELISMRWQNSELRSSLATAETSANESHEELAKIQGEMDARASSLTTAAEQSATEIARLKSELDKTREEALTVERNKLEHDAELAELQKAAEESKADVDRLAKDLDATITDLGDTQAKLTRTESALDDARIALEAAGKEASDLGAQLVGERTETEELKQRLDTAEADLDRTRSLNAGLERQVDLLKTAAGEATDAARQNLLAVENQINEINAALASIAEGDAAPPTIAPAGGPVELGASGSVARSSVISSNNAGDGWPPKPSPPRSAAQPQLIAATAPAAADQTAAQEALDAVTTIEPAAAPDGAVNAAQPSSPPVNLASLTSANQAQDADALIKALDAKREARGLAMTVPGSLLFAVNSDKIEPSARDALSDVAELAAIYEGRDILIIGHTDAVGDATYNQQLSERRAALVKSFFVDEFAIDAERVKVEGQGEQNPITSNATADGRSTNRRVEVVILN